MTASEVVLEEWATTTLGKAARVAVAVVGMITAFLVLLMSTVVSEGSWIFIFLGVALAATSVRAARVPSLARMGVVAVNLAAIPLVAQII